MGRILAALPCDDGLVSHGKLTACNAKRLSIGTGVNHGIARVDKPGLVDGIGSTGKEDGPGVLGKLGRVEKEKIHIGTIIKNSFNRLVHKGKIKRENATMASKHNRIVRDVERLSEIVVDVRKVYHVRYPWVRASIAIGHVLGHTGINITMWFLHGKHAMDDRLDFFGLETSLGAILDAIKKRGIGLS